MWNSIFTDQFLKDFCGRWQVQKLSLFGSALRDDFSPDSDIDLLVSFDPKASWSLFDQARMQNELETSIGRPVDLVVRSALEKSRNYIRRDQILKSARDIYGA